MLLLAAFAAQCLDQARRTSCTVDERGHLPAGVSYWANGDYRVTTNNLFFSQRFAGLGPWLAGYEFPSVSRQTALGNSCHAIGAEYLFQMGHDPVRLLAKARAMVTVLGLSLALLVFFWARRIFGDIGGLGALATYALCPPLVANAALVTTDVATALWYAAAVWAYWWLLAAPSYGRAMLSGATLGMLLLTKFSAVGFAPIACCLLAWHLWHGKRPLPWLRLAVFHLVVILAVWLTIWAFFGFNARPGGYEYPRQLWESSAPGTLLYRTVEVVRRLHLLPDPFLVDCTGLRLLVTVRSTYFAGENLIGGTWAFFPAALFLKTPPATLVALLVAAILSLGALRRKSARTSTDDTAAWPVAATVPLWVLALVFLALCTASPLNIGHRHLLPIYPPLCVLAGGALAWLVHRHRATAAIAAMLVLSNVVEAVWFHGRQPAYLSPLAGGPAHGYRWFIDSTIDWGANLPELAAWQREVIGQEPTARFFLAHLGVDHIAAYGVQGVLLSDSDDLDGLEGGYYVFSATALQMPYVLEPTPPFGTPSTKSKKLALSRLGRYCQQRPVDGRIGDVYFVFQLSDSEVEQALHESISAKGS